MRFFSCIQTGNSHMALLTAPEGSDLEEFKRTRAFMMTRDEDDSSCTSSSSSSRSERCVGGRGLLVMSPFQLRMFWWSVCLLVSYSRRPTTQLNRNTLAADVCSY